MKTAIVQVALIGAITACAMAELDGCVAFFGFVFLVSLFVS